MNNGVYQGLMRKVACRFSYTLLLCLAMSDTWAACIPVEGNHYEEVYCEIHRKGRAQGLPNFFEFRKNPPSVQAILLKGPARKLGITLETSAPTAASATTSTSAPITSTAATPTTTNETNITLPPAESIAEVITPVEMVPDNTSSPFDDCSVLGQTVYCVNGNYLYQANRANSQLEDHVLTDAHKLNLPKQDKNSRVPLQEYLALSYQRYIEGMGEIGLSASTMSFDKFSYVYSSIDEQELNFTERFETMYEFLKKDKASLPVDTRSVISRTFALSNCYLFDDDLLTCEHGGRNYVFRKTP